MKVIQVDIMKLRLQIFFYENALKEIQQKEMLNQKTWQGSAMTFEWVSYNHIIISLKKIN